MCCGYSFELHQMSTYNICLYEEVDKKYTGCNLKTTELLDYALIGICAGNMIEYGTSFAVSPPYEPKCEKTYSVTKTYLYNFDPP